MGSYLCKWVTQTDATRTKDMFSVFSEEHGKFIRFIRGLLHPDGAYLWWLKATHFIF